MTITPIQTGLKTWLKDSVLPYWAEHGFDAKRGLFHERLLSNGQPDLAAPSRVRVQFRQVYCYAHAAVLGWYPAGAELALKAWEATCRDFWHASEGGFVHILAPDGSVMDARRDSYDHAFAILALSWLARATGKAEIRRQLDDVLAYIDGHLMDANGILLEGKPHSLPRRQNPQMHWFEAMLAMHDAIAHPDARRRAEHHHAFFQKTLFDERTSTLGEYFTEDWQWAAGSEGESVEPGHQAEWTWLLRSYERLFGKPASDKASRLLETALRSADPASGLLADETDRSLNIRRATRRSWLQTELCKAWLAEAESGRAGAREAAQQALEGLDKYYLRQPIGAGWQDQLDAGAKPIPGPVPASTLYHILVAVIEAERVLGAA